MTFLHTVSTESDDGTDLPPADQRGRRRKTKRKPWRGGFNSQTTIEGVEDIKCYRLFERAVVSSVTPRTTLELELVHRLASLLWRLRRVSTIEAGLMQLQADDLLGKREQPPAKSNTSGVVRVPFRAACPEGESTSQISAALGMRAEGQGTAMRASGARKIAQCFIGLSRQDPALLDRTGACEARLWRQAAQIIWTLDALRQPPPSPRRAFRRPRLQPFSNFDRPPFSG
jgi:hypothetical protein